MSLTPTEEAQTRQLIAQEAPLLSLAGNEPAITSKLGATKVNLSQLPAATGLADADIALVRQGTTDKSVALSVLKAYSATSVPDATSTVKGIVTLAIASEYPSASDIEVVTPAYVNSALAGASAAVVGTFSNLKASSTGLSALVTVSADELIVESAANAYRTLRAISVAPSLAVSGVNGLDTGTSAANTWYNVFVIWNGTTTAGLLSLSATTPTMPSGYTHKARIGVVRSDGSGNKYPLAFKQAGREVQYTVGSNVTTYPQMSSGSVGNPSAGTYVAVATGSFVPPTAAKIKLFSANGTNFQSVLAPNPNFSGYGSTVNPPPIQSGNSGAVFNGNTVASLLLESTNVYYAATAGLLACVGWEDSL